VMAINLLGVMAGTKEAGRHMAANGGGSIINTTSIGGVQSAAGLWAYHVSKAGVIMFTKSSAIDLGEYGIRVNTIAPGLFDTPLLAALPEDARQKLGAGVPFPPRLGLPFEYAQLACQNVENRMLNGETIPLD
jgi:3-hydroxyacyl-CoA dehydrogenase/3-hydroxy-2-methylbutyryl-CoA dehydrogenase